MGDHVKRKINWHRSSYHFLLAGCSGPLGFNPILNLQYSKNAKRQKRGKFLVFYYLIFILILYLWPLAEYILIISQTINFKVEKN